jgi:glycosyltransferase involved in cell wall biosynthesis
MNNEKTFVILTPGFPSSEHDSTCLPMQQNLVRKLKEIRPDLKLVILSFQYPYHKNTYTWNDLHVIPFNGRNKGGLPKLLLRTQISSVLKKINSTGEIVGLLSFWYNECAWIGKKFADANKLKHRCWVLGQDAKKENTYPGRLKAGDSELIALSDFIREEFQKNHGRTPRHTVPAAIDALEFDKYERTKDIDIVAAGSLIPLKQYEMFIEILPQLQKSLPGVTAALIGDGPERSKLEGMIKNLDVKEKVLVTGELPHKQVLGYMQRAKLFLHPSAYEGFGVVCLEALYAGAQVISFCKPMKTEIPRWHTVKTKEEMLEKALTILRHEKITVERILPYSIDDQAKNILQTFDL